MTDLGNFDGSADNAGGSASGINNAGFITGNSANASNSRNAFLWDPTTGEMTNLGTLGGATSFGLGINGSNMVVGFSRNAENDEEAFLWDPNSGVMNGLGTLDGGGWSRATSINDAGIAVGWASAATGNRRATLFANGQVIDLNSLLDSSGTGWDLIEAYSINNSGQIVGEGNFGGVRMGFVLTVVPEPSSLALASLAGLGGLATWRLRRRR